jgi:hypothetical protein
MPPKFSKPRANLYQSDSGFSVEVLGRTGIRYSERGRTMFIDSEVLATPRAIALYANSIRAWDPPHEADSIGAEDRDRIVENVRLALASDEAELQIT